MEGIWETQNGAPLLLFAIPDEEQRKNHFEIAVPKLASIILTHDSNGEVKGLNEFEGEHPPVKAVFFSFRIMIGVGLLMLIVSWLVSWFLLTKKTLQKKTLLTLVSMSFSGWVATLAGWYVTEIGRQPYLVSGVLKTSEAVTNLPPSNVLFSLIVYVITYTLIMVAFLHTIFYMARKSAAVPEFDLSDLNSGTSLTNYKGNGVNSNNQPIGESV